MRDTFLRMLTLDERNYLHLMLDEDTEAGYRAKIILLKDDGYTVPEIRRLSIITISISENGYSIDSMKKDWME